MDNMRGAIHAKDFLLRDGDTDLEELIRDIPFLPESATAEDALRHMRQEHVRMAFVVDEYGAVEGLVTAEDILEEIVGEIRDEFDITGPPPVERLGESRWRLRGDLSIREWRDLFETEMPEISVDTVGGLIMATLDHIPSEGESVRYGNLKLTVEKTRGLRVETVLLELVEEPGGGQAGGTDD
jgi:putative hemolysin